MTVATTAGSPLFPAAATTIPPTDQAALDAAVAALQAKKDAWVAVPVRERIALVDQLMRGVRATAQRWVDACLQAKGLAPDAGLAGEEWVLGPYALMKALRQLRGSLADIARVGHPRIPGPVTTRADGQVVASVFPQTGYDRLLFTGLTGDIWMQPGVTKENLFSTMAVNYRDKQHPGKVTLVLGAGNVSSIGPLDILDKLFTGDSVVIYKSNPITSYLGPLLEEAFRALIEPGWLRLVYGGAQEGAYLCQHPGVEEIHITGSDKTFDAIVFGPGPEGAARKAAGTPLLDKPITGELGNVSPVIIVPGPWSASDIAYQAAHLASMLTTNAGFNCNATRVMLTSGGWSQRARLLDAVRSVLASVPPRAAYYPGAAERAGRFLDEHPEAEHFGEAGDGHLPWTLIPGVSHENADDIVFTTEAFCSLFAESPLPEAAPAAFLDRAVAFCNEQLYGTLNATILIHPRTQKDPAVSAAMERAVANLRYGTVGVNYWAGASFIMGVTTWGAYPGHTPQNVQSGIGVVHNTLMFSQAEKTVVRAPFKSVPVPPWFATRRRAGGGVFPRLTGLEHKPSPVRLPAILRAALAK